jgi:hypothetical protein
MFAAIFAHKLATAAAFSRKLGNNNVNSSNVTQSKIIDQDIAQTRLHLTGHLGYVAANAELDTYIDVNFATLDNQFYTLP